MRYILLIEDDGNRYRTLRYQLHTLDKKDYQIFWAVTENQLVEFMHEIGWFDLVILDHDLGLSEGKDSSDLMKVHGYELSCMTNRFWIWSHNHIQAPKLADIIRDNSSGEETYKIAPFATDINYYKQLVNFMESQ